MTNKAGELGFRINTRINRPDAELVARFAAFSTTDLSDAMRGSGTMERQIAPMYSPMPRVVGTAVTVSIPTASVNVMKAGFQQAGPGDILVINGMGKMATAYVGANMLRGLLHRGVAAMILDGAVRDVGEIQKDGFPLFARGTVTGAGPNESNAGEVNFPIACGRVVVNPGDIIVADEDGIVVIPPAYAEDVLASVEKLIASYAAIQPILLNGEVTGIAAIEQKLRDAGCSFVDGIP